ncbi:MAG TPA: Ig-like domain-containing protein, partial [bacterium]|nr:Ig-like domain-containing protein [bacterium]
MKSKIYALHNRLFFITIFIVLIINVPAQSASGPAAFEKVSRSPTFQTDSTAVRERFVRWKGGLPLANHAFRPGSKSSIRLNLFDDADYTFALDQVQQRPHGRRAFIGHFKEESGSIGVLTENHGIVSGIFYVLGQGTFKVYSAGNGIHHVVQVNEDGFLCGLTRGHAVSFVDATLQASIPQEGMPSLIPNLYPAGCTFAVNPTVLNLAMVYTPAALAATGGSVEAMEAMVDTMVFYDNLIYANSGINAQVQLVYCGEVNYTESGSMYTDLPRMGNGTIPAIQNIQNTYGAVMVNMLVAGSDPVMGLGYQPGHYSMEHVSFPEAMIHETGHNLGCGHDTANGGPGVYPYSSGSRFNAQGVQYRTIMAYAPGVYTPFFSSPLVTYLGTATGVTNVTDNARTINQMAPILAASAANVTLDSPTVSLASPAMGAVYTGPLTLTLSANVSDAASTIAQVDFYVDSQYLGTAASAPYTLNWPLVPSGSHFVTAHAINSQGTGTYSCPASIFVNDTMPASWVGQDIGWLTQSTATNLELKYMGYLGSETYSGGVYTVNGAGNSVGDNLTGTEQDSFHFVSQPSCGFTTFTARLTGETNGSSSAAQAGLMIRDNNANDSPYFYVGWILGGKTADVLYRTTQGGHSNPVWGSNLGTPVWLQIQRSGNTYTGMESADGTSWITIGSATFTMSPNANIGFAVSGGNTANLASATFDNVTLNISCVPP